MTTLPLVAKKTMEVNLTNGKTLQIRRIIAESTLATQVELANGQIIFIQNSQIVSINK